MFFQLDVEMSFVTPGHIRALIEAMLLQCWPADRGIGGPALGIGGKGAEAPDGRAHCPFPRMSYKDAISQYGVDKPDTRFDMKVNNIFQRLNTYDYYTFRFAQLER